FTSTRMSVSAVFRAILPLRMGALYARGWAKQLPTRKRGWGQHSRLTRARAASTYFAMSDETPDSLIPYDEIVQEALRAVVGRVLGEVEQGGGTLPGNHHFYITFKTG